MRALLIAALLVPADAAALELLCSGTRFKTSVGNVEIQTPLLISEPSLAASFSSALGIVNGTLTDFGTYYGGHVYTPEGHKYWLYLSRYTGDIGLTYTAEDGKTYADFSGTCEKATRKF